MRVNRLSKMKEYINAHGSVTMEQLCEEFNVSMNTVRRDINNLQGTGDVKKVYGGVMSNSSRTLRLYNDRASTNTAAKEQIGMAAARLVMDNDIIYVDAGTTTCEMIPHISAQNVTIFTASISVVEYAMNRQNLNVIILPGHFSRETNSITGADAASYLEQFNIQKAFMSASGFVPSRGATHASLAEAPTKNMAIRQSDISYLLVDSSKFGVSTLINYADSSRFAAVITNTLTDTSWRSQCTSLGIKLIEA